MHSWAKRWDKHHWISEHWGIMTWGDNVSSWNDWKLLWSGTWTLNDAYRPGHLRSSYQQHHCHQTALYQFVSVRKTSYLMLNFLTLWSSIWSSASVKLNRLGGKDRKLLFCHIRHQHGSAWGPRVTEYFHHNSWFLKISSWTRFIIRLPRRKKCPD